MSRLLRACLSVRGVLRLQEVEVAHDAVKRCRRKVISAWCLTAILAVPADACIYSPAFLHSCLYRLCAPPRHDFCFPVSSRVSSPVTSVSAWVWTPVTSSLGIYGLTTAVMSRREEAGVVKSLTGRHVYCPSIILPSLVRHMW